MTEAGIIAPPGGAAAPNPQQTDPGITIAYINGNQMVVMVPAATAPQLSPEFGVSLQGATLYTGGQGELLAPEFPSYKSGLSSHGAAAFTQQLVARRGVFRRRSAAQQTENDWLHATGEQRLRLLSLDDFNLNFRTDGLVVTSKPRDIHFVGVSDGQVVVVTMVGSNLASAEVLYGSETEGMASRHLVREVGPHDTDPGQYRVRVGGLWFESQATPNGLVRKFGSALYRPVGIQCVTHLDQAAGKVYFEL